MWSNLRGCCYPQHRGGSKGRDVAPPSRCLACCVMAYDFSTLSSYDFELLAADLLGQKLGLTFETFTPGRDRGIDLRFMASEDRAVVVQCKHWLKSGWSSLLSHVRREEAAKVAELQPEHYYFVTSVPMTPGRKDEIYGIFSEFMESPADVVGPEDLNSWLRFNPDIERAHNKLWLASEVVLGRVLHSGIYTATEGALEDLRHDVSIYVETPAFGDALKMLEEHGTCIISGVPGVGKTMLANMLMIHSISEGFQPFILQRDVSEADDVYRTTDRQIFLYDDFLGQTTLAEKLGKNEDSRLASLIRRVERAGNKRLLMTTREYILRQARATYAQLDDRLLDRRRYVLRLSRYSDFDRALILYNHLAFSGLDRSEQRGILEDRAYRRIISHQNYNPRLIQYVVSFAVHEETGQALHEFMLETFDHPKRLWEHAVERQLGGTERSVLWALGSFPNAAMVSDLELAARSYVEVGDGRLTQAQFSDALRVLEDTFIQLLLDSSGPLAKFHNASIKDYLLGVLDSNDDLLSQLVQSAVFFEQVELLHDYRNGLHQGWRAGRTVEFSGIRSWFRNNGEQLISRMWELFESPSIRYRTVQLRTGDLVTERESDLARRLSTVVAAAGEHGVDTVGWLPRAFELVVNESVSGKGNRVSFADLVIQLGPDLLSEIPIADISSSQDWFFEEFLGDEDFAAYNALLESGNYWLPRFHQDQIADIANVFVHGELSFVADNVDDPEASFTALETARTIASEYDVELDEGLVAEAEAALDRFGNWDDDDGDGGWRPSTSRSAAADIDALFESL